MKKKSFILLILVTLGMSLMACGNKKEEPVVKAEVIRPEITDTDDAVESNDAHDETILPEDTNTEEEEQDEISYVEYGYAAYDDLIFQIERWMEGDHENFISDELGISGTFTYATDAMGYVREDINGDGIEELLLGEDPWTQGEGSVLYNIFTVTPEGNMVMLANGGERDRFYICQGGVIYEEGSSGADNSMSAYWQINNSKLVEADAPAGTGRMEYTLRYFKDGDALTSEEGKAELEKAAANGDIVCPILYTGDLKDGIFPVNFERENVVETEENLMIKDLEICTLDTYDIADISKLSVGDSIVVDGKVIEVKSKKQDGDTILINGGISEGGVDLGPEKDGNCYIYEGFSDIHTYTVEATKDMPISDKVSYEDKSDLELTVRADRDTLIDTVMYSENDIFVCHNTKVRIENGEIVEIIREYMP